MTFGFRIVTLVMFAVALVACGDGKPRQDKSLPLPEQAKLLASALVPGTDWRDLMSRFKPDRFWLLVPDPTTPGRIGATAKYEYRASSDWMDNVLKEYEGQIHGYGLQHEFGNHIRDEWAVHYEVSFDKDGKLTDWQKWGDD